MKEIIHFSQSKGTLAFNERKVFFSSVIFFYPIIYIIDIFYILFITLRGNITSFDISDR